MQGQGREILNVLVNFHLFDAVIVPGNTKLALADTLVQVICDLRAASTNEEISFVVGALNYGYHFTGTIFRHPPIFPHVLAHHFIS